MYSLTFCVRFLLPERHQWKPAVQTSAVMLRTPPSASGRPRPLPVCGARFWGAPRRPPDAGRRRAQTPPSRPFALCLHIAGWTQACNLGSRYVVIATQPVPRLQIRPIVHNAQLGGSLYHAPSYIRVRAVLWAYGREQTDTKTDTDTQTRVTTIHFASSTTHAKCNNKHFAELGAVHILYNAQQWKAVCYVRYMEGGGSQC